MSGVVADRSICVRNLQYIQGFSSGLKSPSVAFYVDGEVAAIKDIGNHLKMIENVLQGWGFGEHVELEETRKWLALSEFEGALAEWIISSAIWIQSLCGVPITSHGIGRTVNGRLLVHVPTQEIAAPFMTALLESLAKLSSLIASGADISSFSEINKLQETCRNISKSVKKLPPNTQYLLCAAARMEVPVLQKIANFFHFGQGVRSISLNSSLSGRESFFGTATAKDKIASAALLRQMGLPVPEQVKVVTFEAAVDHAARIGYPVVIKPADLDGGNGVFPFLQDAGELAKAWGLARVKSANIVVERHVEGLDYRLLVAKGELIAAIERKPAQVLGDGNQNILQLLEEENARRSAKDGGASLLMPLPNDAETQTVLAAQRMTLESIPSAGVAVKLRRASNHAQGGTVSWCLDRVHPDNVALALHVAELFGLEVAGIDFITPDITRPWWDVPCAICEVNAQPSMGRPTKYALFDRLLSKFLGGGATIPHVALVGDPAVCTTAIASLRQSLVGRGFRVGSVTPHGTFMDDVLIGQHKTIYQGHRMVVMHPRASVALVGVSTPADLRFGLASPKLDFVVPVSGKPDALSRHLSKRFGARIVPLESLLPPPDDVATPRQRKSRPRRSK